jgi:hypothetical protein
MRACVELEGIPSLEESRFQRSAAPTPEIRAGKVIALWTSKLAPMVAATAVPKRKGPRNPARALNPSARRGGRAREAMTVATMLELST